MPHSLHSSALTAVAQSCLSLSATLQHFLFPLTPLLAVPATELQRPHSLTSHCTDGKIEAQDDCPGVRASQRLIQACPAPSRDTPCRGQIQTLGWGTPEFEDSSKPRLGQGPPLPLQGLSCQLLAGFSLVSASSAKCESLFSSLLILEPSPPTARGA